MLIIYIQHLRCWSENRTQKGVYLVILMVPNAIQLTLTWTKASRFDIIKLFVWVWVSICPFSCIECDTFLYWINLISWRALIEQGKTSNRTNSQTFMFQNFSIQHSIEYFPRSSFFFLVICCFVIAKNIKVRAIAKTRHSNHIIRQ